MEKFQPKICGHCGQSETYVLAISKGVANIVRAFSVAIRNKGINIIHPAKEMMVSPKDWSVKEMLAVGCITPQMEKNMSFARAHGLIARVKDQTGNWCLTTKGAEFLRGREIPKYAVMSKVTKHQEGYFMPNELTVKVSDFLDDDPNWELIDYTIVEGRIIKDLKELKKEQNHEPRVQSLFENYPAQAQGRA